MVTGCREFRGTPPFSLRSRRKCLQRMAGATGLEPATFGVTGRRSNQLSYAPTLFAREYARAGEIRDPPGQVKVATVRSSSRVRYRARVVRRLRQRAALGDVAQQRVACGRRRQMLERMPAHRRAAGRVDRAVEVFESLR